jgi:hypothetical protein
MVGILAHPTVLLILILALFTLHCLFSLWSKTVLQSFNVFHSSTNVSIVPQITCHVFFLCFWSYFTFLLAVFHNFSKVNKHFKLKMDSNGGDCFIGPS